MGAATQLEQAALSLLTEHRLVASKGCGAVQLSVLVRKDVVVERTRCKAVKTGWLGGLLANKGGALAEIELESGCVLRFLSCHLPAHQKKVVERTKAFGKILSKSGANTATAANTTGSGNNRIAPDPEGGGNTKELLFVLGDLNFRINASREEVDALIEGAEHDQLLEKDQLKPLLGQGVFEGLSEQTLRFPPTYKFDKSARFTDSLVYDGSAKQRIPSWTDRVLFPDSRRVEPKSYGAVFDPKLGITLSDHRPVFAQFEIKER